jgi:hypothetical protein
LPFSASIFHQSYHYFWTGYGGKVRDDKSKKNVRVVGSIDDGGIRAFFPMSLDFLITPDETLVGE